MSLARFNHGVHHRVRGTTHNELEADRRERDLRRAIGLDIRRQLEDAGISQAALARAAHLSPAQLSRILAGAESPSLHALTSITTALDGRLVVRLDPLTGPRIRDHLQARIVEAPLRIAHPRWKRFLEVPVHRPVRGVIDLVFHEPVESVVVATEVHSQIRRWEQQQRWANMKADALIGGSELPLLATSARTPTASRLLVLRSTAATRDLVRQLGESVRTAYPAAPEDAFRSLTTADAPWAGTAILWATVDGADVRILDRPPRGLAVSRWSRIWT